MPEHRARGLPHDLGLGRWSGEGGRIADWGLAGLVAAVAQALLWSTPHGRGPSVLLGACLVAAATLPIGLRQSWPYPVFALSGIAALGHVLIGQQNSFPVTFAVLVALFTVAGHSSPRVAWLAALQVALLLPLNFAFTWSQQHQVTLSDIPYNYGLFATAFVLGDDLRQRRARIAELQANADRVQREQTESLRQAREEERLGIARELHDVIAHSVSVMVLQAGAARRIAARQPLAAQEALTTIERTGRQAMHETRRLLGMVRSVTDRADVAPQPGLSELGRLVAGLQESGLEVGLEVSGERRLLSPGLELSAYRIIQEALTNTIKHSDAHRAQVHVQYRADRLELTITDQGQPKSASVGVGHGLVGMGERVSLFGGTLEAAAQPGTGWRVAAMLPFEGRS